MRVMVEAVDELLDVLADDRVMGDLVHPRVELGCRGQLAVQQEVCRFQEGALLGELLDRVAAVTQDPFVTIDVADRAATRRRIHERGIVAHQPKVVGRRLDLPQIGRADRPVLNRELVARARTVIHDGEGVLRHSCVLNLGAEKITGYWVSGIWYPYPIPATSLILAVRGPAPS